jgi:protein ImuB
MVTHTGTADRPARIRPLNNPRPLQVEVDADSRPAAVLFSGQRLTVESVLETWRIDDEWWRQRPVSRVYWRLLLEDGRTVDVYRDAVSGKWFRQAY